MNRIYPLFSSSKGNSTYIGNEQSGVLVDVGVSCKRLCTALEENSLSPEAVQGILITHTHSDHVKGLRVFAKKYGIPIFAQNTNLCILDDKGILPENCKAYAVDNCEFTLGNFTVNAFETHHDTPASCGYRFCCDDGTSAVVCTDLGEITNVVWQNICGASAVLIESNYDDFMLKNGSYSFELKQRIASDHGHLSNYDCAKVIKNMLESGTKKFILGHLSEENNLPDVAEEAVLSELRGFERGKDYSLVTASPCGCKAVEF